MAERDAIVDLGEYLEKAKRQAGPFIGPRGGMWADPQHKIPWDPKKHGPGQMGLFAGPTKPKPKREPHRATPKAKDLAQAKQLLTQAHKHYKENIKPSKPVTENLDIVNQAIEMAREGMKLVTKWEPEGKLYRQLEDERNYLIGLQNQLQEKKDRAETYQEKMSEKQERLEARAAKKRAEAQSAFEQERRIGEAIPMGQPILVGHHSEKRHRRDIEKIRNLATKQVEAHKEAQRLEQRAASVGTSGISSDDPEAVQKLLAKIESAEQSQREMKRINKIVRKKGMTPERLAKEAGIKESLAHQVMEPDFAGRIGFPSYALTNNNANIRRMKQRVEQLRKEAERTPAAPIEGRGFRIEEDVDDNRIRFYFDTKPEREVIQKMKRAGFRWSPTAGAWQRHLNEAGRYAAKRMAEELFPSDEPIAQTEQVTEPTKEAAVDPELWTSAPKFGVAGGPEEIQLTGKGADRAFSVGAQVTEEKGRALQMLSARGGTGEIISMSGSGIIQSALVMSGHIERIPQTDLVKLTEKGRAAVEAGHAEQERLLERIKRTEKSMDAIEQLEQFAKAGGEGSRGGKVIGHRADGSPIYAGQEATKTEKMRAKLAQMKQRTATARQGAEQAKQRAAAKKKELSDVQTQTPSAKRKRIKELESKIARTKQETEKIDRDIDKSMDALIKAGPFIGPKGGKWADPKHTIPWDEKKHGKKKKGILQRVTTKLAEIGEAAERVEREQKPIWEYLKPRAAEKSMDAIDHLGDYFQKAYVGETRRVEDWSSQFWGTPLEVESLQLTKKCMTLKREKAEWREKGKPWRDRNQMSAVARAKYEEQRDKEEDAFDKRCAENEANKRKLEERLIDHRIDEAKRMGKSDEAISQIIYHQTEQFQKSDDGKPGESLKETSTDELIETHKDLVSRLKQKPDDKALQSRYNAIDSEIRRRGEHYEHETPAHMAKKALPSEEAKLTPEKARKILHDKEVHGKPLTEQQRKFFGAVASRGKKKAEKSMTGIEALGEYLEKADTTTDSPQPKLGEATKISGDNAAGAGDMPHNDPSLTTKTPDDGEDLEGKGKKHNKKGPAGFAHPASASPGDKLSDDDAEVEDQMKPAGASEFRGGQKAMMRKSDPDTNYTRQELDHTVRHERAIAIQQMQKSEPDLTVVGGNPPKPTVPEMEKSQTFRQGDLVTYSNGSDIACEQLQKSNDFYHGAAPAIDATGTLRKSVTCPNGHQMPAMLSSCPSCGVGAAHQAPAGSGIHEAAPHLLKSGRGLVPTHEPDLVLPNGTIVDDDEQE